MRAENTNDFRRAKTKDFGWMDSGRSCDELETVFRAEGDLTVLRSGLRLKIVFLLRSGSFFLIPYRTLRVLAELSVSLPCQRPFRWM